jgi:hypothetical protein
MTNWWKTPRTGITAPDTGVVLGIIDVVVFVSFSVWLLVAARHQNTAALFNPCLQSAIRPG